MSTRHHRPSRTILSASVLAAVLPLAAWLLAAGCSSLPRRPDHTVPALTRADALRRAGARHYREGRFLTAAASYRRAAELSGSLDDQTGVAAALDGLGRCRLAAGDTTRARLAFRASLDAAASAGAPARQARALDGLAVTALARGDPATARRRLERALALPLPADGPERPVLEHDLGVTLARLGKTVEGETLLERALARNAVRRDRIALAADCLALARLRLAAGDLAHADTLAARALAADRHAANAAGVAADLELLAEIAAARGDTAAAADYRRRARLARVGRETGPATE